MTISGTDYTKIIALKTQELEMGRINRRRRRAKYYCDTGSDRLICLTDQIVSSSIYSKANRGMRSDNDTFGHP
jgi:hypothetical protein